MANEPTIGTVIIFTTQMETLADFYRAGLGIGPFHSSPRHLGCQVGNLYFGFDQVDSVETGSGSGVTLWFSVDDLQATFDRFVSLGAKVRYPPTRKPHAGYLASLFDLDGNILGLAQREQPSESG